MIFRTRQGNRAIADHIRERLAVGNAMKPLIARPLADAIHVGCAALCQKILQVDGARFRGKAREPGRIHHTSMQMRGGENRERSWRYRNANLIAIINGSLCRRQSWRATIFAHPPPVPALCVVCHFGTPMSRIDGQSPIPV